MSCETDQEVKLGQKAICTWPGGEQKLVSVARLDGKTAFVLWNEEHAPMGEQGCVVGLEATVPVGWLSHAWVAHWVFCKSEEKWYHYWPDATEFGPFRTESDAWFDCIRQAPGFDS